VKIALSHNTLQDVGMSGGRIYSVGYEGLTVSGLVERLSQSHVTMLVDVRLTPSSRRPGFSKRALSQALAGAGIEYVHERQLGNPPDNRASFRSGDGEAGRRRMRERLENGSGAALQWLAREAAERRVAVLCVERESHRCHRNVITDMAKELEPELEIIDVL
jgi:uncharacterized protein (DUF488 family)